MPKFLIRTLGSLHVICKFCTLFLAFSTIKFCRVSFSFLLDFSVVYNIFRAEQSWSFRSSVQASARAFFDLAFGVFLAADAIDICRRHRYLGDQHIWHVLQKRNWCAKVYISCRTSYPIRTCWTWVITLHWPASTQPVADLPNYLPRNTNRLTSNTGKFDYYL